jgi:hypothetical protein
MSPRCLYLTLSRVFSSYIFSGPFLTFLFLLWSTHCLDPNMELGKGEGEGRKDRRGRMGGTLSLPAACCPSLHIIVSGAWCLLGEWLAFSRYTPSPSIWLQYHTSLYAPKYVCCIILESCLVCDVVDCGVMCCAALCCSLVVGALSYLRCSLRSCGAVWWFLLSCLVLRPS